MQANMNLACYTNNAALHFCLEKQVSFN